VVIQSGDQILSSTIIADYRMYDGNWFVASLAYTTTDAQVAQPGWSISEEFSIDTHHLAIVFVPTIHAYMLQAIRSPADGSVIYSFTVVTTGM